MIAASNQRCWNHQDREAVCRCPECGRSFCRECVSEHESRLLCAACLTRAPKASAAAPHRMRKRVAPLLMMAAALLVAWITLFGAGESMLILAERAEQAQWQNR